jgi:hypothetical protein
MRLNTMSLRAVLASEIRRSFAPLRMKADRIMMRADRIRVRADRVRMTADRVRMRADRIRVRADSEGTKLERPLNAVRKTLGMQRWLRGIRIKARNETGMSFVCIKKNAGALLPLRGTWRQRRNETGMSFRIRSDSRIPFFVLYFSGTKLECPLESIKARGTNPNTNPKNAETNPTLCARIKQLEVLDHSLQVLS